MLSSWVPSTGARAIRPGSVVRILTSARMISYDTAATTGHQHDLTDKPHRRGQQAERGKDADTHQCDDDEKPSAAAGMEAAALANMRNVNGVAGLERVDRHVLGAVVLKQPAHIRDQADQQQVQDQDRGANHALDEHGA